MYGGRPGRRRRTEYADEGIDPVCSKINYTLAANVEHLNLIDAGSIDGTATGPPSPPRATRTGLSATTATTRSFFAGCQNWLFGGTGGDWLGVSGNDVVIALNGSDILTLQNVQLGALTASHFDPA
jgi:hypothetical protein